VTHHLGDLVEGIAAVTTSGGALFGGLKLAGMFGGFGGGATAAGGAAAGAGGAAAASAGGMTAAEAAAAFGGGGVAAPAVAAGGAALALPAIVATGTGLAAGGVVKYIAEGGMEDDIRSIFKKILGGDGSAYTGPLPQTTHRIEVFSKDPGLGGKPRAADNSRDPHG